MGAALCRWLLIPPPQPLRKAFPVHSQTSPGMLPSCSPCANIVDHNLRLFNFPPPLVCEFHEGKECASTLPHRSSVRLSWIYEWVPLLQIRIWVPYIKRLPLRREMYSCHEIQGFSEGENRLKMLQKFLPLSEKLKDFTPSLTFRDKINDRTFQIVTGKERNSYSPIPLWGSGGQETNFSTSARFSLRPQR